MKHHYAPTQMSKRKEKYPVLARNWCNCNSNTLPCINAKWCSLFGKQLGSFFPHKSAIQFLTIHWREKKTCLHEDLYTNLYSSLIIIINIWEQSKCPSPEEWITKLWHKYTVKTSSQSSTKKDMHAITWMNLKSTVLSKSSHKRLHTILHNSIYITFWQRQTMGTKIRSVATRSCWEGSRRLPSKEHEGISDNETFCILLVVVVIWLCSFVQT